MGIHSECHDAHGFRVLDDAHDRHVHHDDFHDELDDDLRDVQIEGELLD